MDTKEFCRNNPTFMIQLFEFTKAFLIINIVWTSDKICLFLVGLTRASSLEHFLRDSQMFVNIIVSILVGILTIIKIYKLINKKNRNTEYSDEEN